jgi:WD40 repeat protein
VASGSKDNEVKLWDPRAGTSLATLFGHKNTVLAVAWNPSNGNWLATSGRDHLIKLYDIRTNREWLTLQGHDREVCSLAWHPNQEGLLTSGGFNGSLAYWVISHQAGGQLTPHTYIGRAHNYSVNMIAWHGFGHLLATASNDGIVKFWSREPPGSALTALHQEESQEQQLELQYGPRLEAGQDSSADSDPFAADSKHLTHTRTSFVEHSQLTVVVRVVCGASTELNTHLEEIRAPDAGAKSLRLRNPLPSVSSKVQSLVTITDSASRQQKRKRLLSAPL